MVHKGPARADVEARSDDDIGVSIAIYVTRRAHRKAEFDAGLIDLGSPASGGIQPLGRAIMNIGSALIDVPAVELGCPDYDVGVAIAVHVSRPTH